jgi:hypothetical protein
MGYLWFGRGFNESQLISVLKTTAIKEQFWKCFNREVVEGRVIVVAWFSDVENKVSWMNHRVYGDYIISIMSGNQMMLSP